MRLDNHLNEELIVLGGWLDDRGVGLGPKLKSYIAHECGRSDLSGRIRVMRGIVGNTVDQLIAFASEVKQTYGTGCRLMLITNRRYALRVWATVKCLGFKWGWIDSQEPLQTSFAEDTIGFIVNIIDPFWVAPGRMLRLIVLRKERRCQAEWRSFKRSP